MSGAAKERIGDRTVIASVSGGKDSTAMCLHLKELGIPYRAVFMDTGWEHEDVYRYLEDELPKHIGPIKVLRRHIEVKPGREAVVSRLEEMLGRESPMVRLVINRGTFPSRTRRICTPEIKIRPFREYLDALDVEPVVTVGVRASESLARSRLPEWERWSDSDCDQWRPLIAWTDDQVVAIHQRHDVPPNPLYLRGAHRVGCWPCIFARKSEIRNLSETDPGRVDFMRELEQAVMEIARDRYAEQGETFESKGYQPPAWFTRPTRDPSGHRPPWPFDKVIEWSRTSHGGRQIEWLTAPPREWGCMRWGVCDTGGVR